MNKPTKLIPLKIYLLEIKQLQNDINNKKKELQYLNDLINKKVSSLASEDLILYREYNKPF